MRQQQPQQLRQKGDHDETRFRLDNLKVPFKMQSTFTGMPGERGFFAYPLEFATRIYCKRGSVKVCCHLNSPDAEWLAWCPVINFAKSELFQPRLRRSISR